MVIFAVAAALVVALSAGHAWMAALAVAAGYLCWYSFSIWRRPQRPCWWCKGRGRTTGHDPGNEGGRNPFGRCWVCHGRQAQVRWGVRWFMPTTARRIRAGQRGRNF